MLRGENKFNVKQAAFALDATVFILLLTFNYLISPMLHLLKAPLD